MAESVKLVAFDMGHVFMDFDWQQVCEHFCQRSGYSLTQLHEVMVKLSTLGYESGGIDTAGFLAEVNRLLQTDLTREEFTTIWLTSFTENAEMTELFDILKQGRPLYLLSNTNEVQYEWLQERYNVERHFTELILSYKVGYVKPDPRIYAEVMNRSGFKAAQCLFVDDLECNIDAAAELGMRTILFTGVDDLKQRLRDFGLLS